MKLLRSTAPLLAAAICVGGPALSVERVEAQVQAESFGAGIFNTQSSAQRSVGEDHDWFGSRLKVRAHHLFTNYDTVRGDEGGTGGKLGYGGGLEIVLPSGFSFGVVGYTNGRVSEWDTDLNMVNVAAEFNYFLKLRALRLAPFVGVHGGLVRFAGGEFQDISWHDGFSDLGYQYGVRFQPFALLGVDVQMRHLSTFMGSDGFDGSTDRHFLIGMTLF
jgi:hypothetical protein